MCIPDMGTAGDDSDPSPLMIDGETVDTVEFQGRKLVVLSNEQVDTGAGILNGPIMPLPTLLLDLFGTPAVFTLNTQTSTTRNRGPAPTRSERTFTPRA